MVIQLLIKNVTRRGID